jgi:hypothetical protein
LRLLVSSRTSIALLLIWQRLKHSRRALFAKNFTITDYSKFAGTANSFEQHATRLSCLELIFSKGAEQTGSFAIKRLKMTACTTQTRPLIR